MPTVMADQTNFEALKQYWNLGGLTVKKLNFEAYLEFRENFVTNLFFLVDQDLNGSVTLAELKTAVSSWVRSLSDKYAPVLPVLTSILTRKAPEFFNEVDLNGDGQLTLFEFSA